MMHTHYLRCIQADAAALVDLLVGLGALVRATDDGTGLLTAPTGTWDPIGLIHKRTGGTDEDPVHQPVADGLGRPYWHANLATTVDVSGAIDEADWGRWFIVDAGQITAPLTPLRIMAGWAPPAPPEPPRVPQVVTMRQARLALLGIGKLAAVTAAINSLPSPQKEAAQIEWEYSATVERGRPFVQMLAPALGLTDAQLDALFTAAARL